MWQPVIDLITNLPSLVKDIIISSFILVFGYFFLDFIKKFIFRQLRKISDHNEHILTTTFIELLNQYFLPISYFGLFYLTVKEINLHPTVLTTTKTILILATTFYVAQLLVDISRISISFYSTKYQLSDQNIESKINALFPALRVMIWTLATIFILSNLGLDVGAIVAGLGIGGVAIALASQGILQDLFSYFAILFDCPFEIYDLVSVDDFVGYVEHIGIKTTRIKALTGEQIILANTDLTNSRLRNFKRMQRRQVILTIGVIYQTPHELLEEIPEIIKYALKDINIITLDIAYFSSYGDFSLDFEVIFYVHSNELKKYRQAKHKVNLAIKNAFTQHNIEFAYPTQLNYFASEKPMKNE